AISSHSSPLPTPPPHSLSLSPLSGLPLSQLPPLAIAAAPSSAAPLQCSSLEPPSPHVPSLLFPSLLQPIYQECHYPSRPLWKLLRRQHLLHPTGLPLFNPDWTHRSHPPLSSQEARSFPSDWVVVLAKRAKGKRRSMENGDEVEEEVVRRFGHERVVTYNGSLPILQ
ncbi:unnamed protein product, partial [Closterium sp. NIES-54]